MTGRRKRPVRFRIIANDDHPVAGDLWERVEKEASGNDPLVPQPLIDLLDHDDEPFVEVSLEEAEEVRRWCAERPWWPVRGPAPLRFERISPPRGPDPDPEKAKLDASILVPLTKEEREELNREAERLGLTQRELARRRITKRA